MASGLFGLKLFWESVSEYTRGRNKDNTADIDTLIPNKQSLLKAGKFLNDGDITKKLNNYKKIANVLGAKFKIVNAAIGKLANNGCVAGFAKQSALFSININNRVLEKLAHTLFENG